MTSGDELRVMASFDLNPKHARWPLGRPATSLSERETSAARRPGLSVSYTARFFRRPGTWSQLTATSDDKIDVALTQIVPQYDFN
jgi:hypothetical protein